MKYHLNDRPVASMALVLAGVLPTIVRAVPPQVGAPAPPLGLEKLLQAHDGAASDWVSLRGKVVVLEFWATWCEPCVHAIPLLNKLADRFKDKPVQFISITDEPESVVTPFLQKRPIGGWIGLDTDGSTFQAYGVSRRPATVVVDQHGKVVGWPMPYTLVDHPAILDDLLAGKARKLSGPPDQPSLDVLTELGMDIEQLAEAERNQPLCLIAIRPAQPVKRKLRSGSGRKSFDRALTLRRAIARIYQVPEVRIISAIPLPEDQKYDIVFSWPEGDMRLGRALLRQAFEATFGLSIRREKRAMDVYVLAVPSGAKPTLEPGMSRLLYDAETDHYAPTAEVLARMNAGEAFFMAMGDTGAFADNLSFPLSRPVVDEADIEGYYLFYFPYDFEKPDWKWLIKTVEEKYGLTLTAAKREIEVLVVEASGTGASGSR